MIIYTKSKILCRAKVIMHGNWYTRDSYFCTKKILGAFTRN